MARPRKLKDNEDWVIYTFNLSPSDAREFERLRKDKTNGEFVLHLLRAFKVHRREHLARKVKSRSVG